MLPLLREGVMLDPMLGSCAGLVHTSVRGGDPDPGPGPPPGRNSELRSGAEPLVPDDLRRILGHGEHQEET